MDMATCPLVWVPTLIQKIFARFRPQRERHLALQPSNFARLRSNLLAMGRGRRAIVPMRGCMDHHCPLSAFKLPQRPVRTSASCPLPAQFATSNAFPSLGCHTLLSAHHRTRPTRQRQPWETGEHTLARELGYAQSGTVYVGATLSSLSNVC